MEKVVVLRQTRDENGTRHLRAVLASNGDVKIKGQDLGVGVEKFFGEGFMEYEYILTIRTADVPVLRDALGASSDVLSALQQHFSNLDVADPRSFLEEYDIRYEFWSRIGE